MEKKTLSKKEALTAMGYKTSLIKKECTKETEFTFTGTNYHSLSEFIRKGVATEFWENADTNVTYFRLPEKYELYTGSLIVQDSFGISMYDYNSGKSLNSLDKETEIDKAIALLKSANFVCLSLDAQLDNQRMVEWISMNSTFSGNSWRLNEFLTQLNNGNPFVTRTIDMYSLYAKWKREYQK